MALGLGRLLKDTDESQTISLVQAVLPGGEVRSDIPLMQHYGFASRPRAGGDVVVVFQGGDRAQGVAVATGDQRNRPTWLQPGEVALYHPPTGARIRMQADGSISIEPGNGNVHAAGNWDFSGQITAKEVVAGGVKLSLHEHPGVQKGGSKTGAPAPS